MDQVAICNLALGWVGSNPITSVDDASTTAELCKANWDAVRDAVLEAKAWTFAVERTSIAADATAPAYGYTLRYQVPSTLLRVLEVDDGSGHGDIEWVKEGQHLLTDQASPLYVRYLKRVEDTALWTPAFAMAVAYRLAFVLATPLTENRSLQSDLWTLYQKALKDAAHFDGMQGRAESTRVSELRYRRW
jgi:hypothetical protein